MYSENKIRPVVGDIAVTIPLKKCLVLVGYIGVIETTCRLQCSDQRACQYNLWSMMLRLIIIESNAYDMSKNTTPTMSPLSNAFCQASDRWSKKTGLNGPYKILIAEDTGDLV